MLGAIFPGWALFLSKIFQAIINWILGLSITRFDPRSGWPGTIITITGHGFSPNRDDNDVFIGTQRALVIDADTNRLVVLAGEHTTTASLRVTVGSRTATSDPFAVLPQPSITDPSQAGPPRFFHGPQNGTPKTNVANQKVLVIFCYPSDADADPGTPADRSALRNTEITGFENARRYWNEASYGSTTWDISYSDWVPLKKDRRTFFWVQADVDDARRILMVASSRVLSWVGTSIANGSDNGWIPIEHASPLSWSYLLGPASVGSPIMALKRSGNLLYAGTDKGGFFVYDVTNPGSAVLRGSLNLPGNPIWGIDLVGTIAVAAVRNGGTALINVANASAPTLIALGATPTDWGSDIKAVGNRIYLAQGTSLQIFDLVAMALTPVATLQLDAWGTAVDVDGTVAAVSTDGDGVHIFELTAAGAVARGTYHGVSRVRSLRLAGGHAFLAANTAGLVVLDLANLDAPTQVAQKVTAKPAYDVAIQGSELLLAVGSVVLVSFNIADPTKPTINGTEMASAAEGDLGAWRDGLTIATDSANTMKSGDRLFVAALQNYFASTSTNAPGLNDLKGIILVVNGGFLRGQSWKQQTYSDAGNVVALNDEKGAIYLATGAAWGRKAHEIGHWLGMWDIYAEQYADGTVLEGTAAPWCLSGSHDLGPLFCGHHMTEIMNWYAPGDPTVGATNMLELAWSPTSALNETYEVVAHGASKEAAVNRYHVIKLVAATGLIYFVEVRERPAGKIFDQNIDIPAAEPGRVIVLRVTEGTSISNTFERPIQLFEKLTVGDQAVDAARNLIIKVEEKIQDAPLAFRVRVMWNQPIPGDPNGTFDLTITPWSTDTWESKDIWIDSPRNNNGASPVFEFHEAGAPDRPILNGDHPWVKHANKIFARIRNTGPLPSPEAWVSCYVTSPPGIGDNGSWALLKTKKIASVPGNGEMIVDFDWKPSVSGHTCIKVAILPQIGEIQTDNNFAQENVATFDSSAASSHQPVVLEAEVRSPFTVWRKVDLLVKGLPVGWHAVVDHAWVWVPGKASHPVKAVIFTDRGTPAGSDQRVPDLALARVEGWTDFGHRYVPIGGILAPVRAVKRVTVGIRLEAGGGRIYVWGELVPAVAGVVVCVEIIDETGSTLYLYATSAANGRFNVDTMSGGGRPLKRGKYTAQAFTAGGAGAAEAESDVVVVDLKT
jgi:hypothetical protein